MSSPSGSTTDDVLVAFVLTAKYSAAGDQPSTPSGWTLIRSAVYTGNVRLTAFYRAWTSGSHSFTNPTSNTSTAAVIAVQGGNVGDISSSTGETGSGTPLVLQALTAGEGDVLLSAIASAIVTLSAAEFTPPSGMTERVDSVSADAYDYGGGYFGVPTLGVASLDNLSAGSTGTKSWTISGDFPESVGFGVLVGAAVTATSHDATATSTVTASRTAAAVLERFGAASSSLTATGTAAGLVEKFAAASSSATATLTADGLAERVAEATATTTATLTAAADVVTPGVLTADATLTETATLTAAGLRGQFAAATSSTTATLTAAADVVSPGLHTADATLALTSTATAGAALEATVAAALTATATVTATGNVATVHDTDATRAVTVTISADATVLVGGVGSSGSMRPADIVGATMRAAGTTGTTMRTYLVAFNTATMQAVLDDTATAPLVGVPTFTGPTDPVTLGLVALTDPHVWYHDGTVTVREG